MEASDDEFIDFDIGTSLLSTEDKVKTAAFWKLLDEDDETKQSRWTYFWSTIQPIEHCE